MHYIGLTGNIASGKSEVARILAQLGATIIDADELARAAVAPGTPALARIAERWGPDILLPNGTLNRAALRARVFGDASELAALNAIVHPEVGRLRDAALAESRARGDEVVVYMVPLLFEARLEPEFDTIILVDAPEETRLRRLVETRGLDRETAQRMIAAQMPAAEKRARSHIIFENDGTVAALEAQVHTAWPQLTHPSGRSSLAR